MKISCLFSHKWSAWGLHPAYGNRMIRHCIRCGLLEEKRI
jgi:hypothetical protein